MRQEFMTKCARFFITKCDSFITKCDSYYKLRKYGFCCKISLSLTSNTNYYYFCFCSYFVVVVIVVVVATVLFVYLILLTQKVTPWKFFKQPVTKFAEAYAEPCQTSSPR